MRLIRSACQIILAVCAACASSPVGDLRFRNGPPVLRLDDRRPIPLPEAREFKPTLYHLNGYFLRPIIRTLEIRERRRALAVNSMDEVPDSTWFTNRIGRGGVAPDTLLRGAPGGEPDRGDYWWVHGGQLGGANEHLVVVDRRGGRFRIDLDPPGSSEMQTGAAVVTQRLLWAVGYNVLPAAIVRLDPRRLLLAPDAEVIDELEETRPMEELDVTTIIAGTDRAADGTIRALATRLPEGLNIGGYPQEDVRDDDPNDTVPHEDRRDLRGQIVFFSWLAHTDVKEDKTLDVWIDGHLVHYLIDFRGALGAMGWVEPRESDGWTHTIDVGSNIASLLSFGLHVRPWEQVVTPNFRGLGRFESRRFDPETFEVRFPYAPFGRVDDHDRFWATKILLRVTDAHVEAALAAARYSDPRTPAYLLRVLGERRRKIAYRWLSRVAALEGFAIEERAEGVRACFDDLWVRHGFGAEERRVYRAATYDFVGEPIGAEVEGESGAGGEACVSGLAAAPAALHEGYTIVRIVTERDGQELPPMLVHLARAPKTGKLRVIGVRRE